VALNAFELIRIHHAAAFHALNYSMFQLAKGYKATQMAAYVQLQEQEFASEKDGYTAAKHQREVGAGYFDDVTQTVTAGQSSVTAMKGSTEEEQFQQGVVIWPS
jgi:isocitrate lyase